MMAPMPLAVTLRVRDSAPPGLAPAGPLRDRQAEKRRALAKATDEALADVKPDRINEWTQWKNGDASSVYQELKRAKPLPIVARAPAEAKLTDSQRQRRLAAASRWQKARCVAALKAGSEAPQTTAPMPLQVSKPEQHNVRRGEFDLMRGSYKQYSDAELLELVYKVRDKQLKTTELKKLYDDGDIKVPPTTVTNVLYPKLERDAKIAKLETSGTVAMGAPRQVLTKDQELFALGLVAEMAFQHRPLSPEEVLRWAQLTAADNGTRSGDENMRAWYDGFKRRVKRETCIDLDEVETQQLSKQRAGVLLSGVRAFAGMVTSLLSEHPLLAACGLEAPGNWDELKMDLNKLLTDGKSVVPKGEVPRWEVPGERCEQITLLIGYAGFRKEGTANPAGKLLSLKQVHELIKSGKLASFGEVAGYPKLPPGFWDGPDFCVLVGLLIFKGAAGADPAWLNLVQDKTRLMVATTESGYINTKLKYEWYKANKQLEHCPFGKHPTIPNADSHISNESIEMSAEMELEDEAYLIAPSGHSTHLTQQLDQTGGPIEHYKHIEKPLMKNMYRLRGKLSKQRIAQVVELGITLAFTPLNCSWATEHVGWGEDDRGHLIYDPLSRPHIMAGLVNDEAPSSTLATVPAATCSLAAMSPAAITPSATTSALAALRAGDMDGEAGIAAGRKAALAVLGRTKDEADGWADEEDMEEVIEEEGSRGRRRGLPNGRLVACREFREAKEQSTTSAADAKAAEQLQGFRKRRLNERVLAENATAEAQLTTVGAIKTQPLMISFVRARTGKPVSDKGEDLKAKVVELRNKPISISLGLEPDGYQAWLASLKEKERAVPHALPPPPLALPPPPPPLPVPPPPLALPPPAELAELTAAQARPRRNL